MKLPTSWTDQLPGDKVSGLIKVGFGRQGYGMPPSLGLGYATSILIATTCCGVRHPVTSSNGHDPPQSSTLMVEELNNAGPSSERRMGRLLMHGYDRRPQPQALPSERGPSTMAMRRRDTSE